MREHILVTGGAGYIGSVLVPELLAQDFQVTVLDNFMYRQKSLNETAKHPKCRVVEGDVCRALDIKPLLKKTDIILPLAALVGAPLCDKHPEKATATNKTAIEAMVKLLSDQQRVLVPITNSGYGVGEQDRFCTEDSPLRPVSLYGRDKVAAEAAVMAHPAAISFRLATVFGMSPRMRIDLLVNNFTFHAVYDGEIMLFEGHFKRNFVHVKDVARAFLHGISNFDAMRGQVYNVGLSEANLSKRELCERIKEQVPGFRIFESETGKDPDQRDYIVSNAKIEAAGYKAVHSLEEGIAELIEGYAPFQKDEILKFTNI